MTQFTRISCEDANSMMAERTISVIDIRDEQSFAASHITHAEHIDNSSIADFIQETDRNTPVLVCCYHGNSSQSASGYLVEQGFTEVYSLDGGFSAWQMQFPNHCESGN